MMRDEIIRVVDQAHVSIAAGPDHAWLGERLPPSLWEPLRVEMQRRYRRSTGEELAVLTIEPAADLFASGGRFVFGLEAQGHIPTVERMLAAGRDWASIGRAIGWDGDTAREYYGRHVARRDIREAASGADVSVEGMDAGGTAADAATTRATNECAEKTLARIAMLFPDWHGQGNLADFIERSLCDLTKDNDHEADRR